MTEPTRKQREIERRTAEILRVSRPILVREGFHALSMDRVAASMEYAKGTIYNHFPHKEEIVLALGLQAMELRLKLFQYAANSAPSPRHRMMALGVACEFYTGHCHEEFMIEQCVRNPTVWEKSSEERQGLVRQCEGGCMEHVSGIVRAAVSVGDLQIPNGMTPEEFVFGFWAITFGTQILVASSPSLPAIGVLDPIKAMRIHCGTMMNGFDWKPIASMDEHLVEMDRLSKTLVPYFHSLRKSSGWGNDELAAKG